MKKKNIYFLGDIHGNFELIDYYCRIYKLKSVCIIQVGDFGLGFKKNEKERLENLNNKLAENDNILLAIRGNHDNKDLWYNDTYNFSNITFVKDYTVMNINDLNFLFIGGATSIDAKDRTIGYDYWENEVIEFNDEYAKYLEGLRNIDVLITHATPTRCFPLIGSYKNNDRPILDNIFELLQKNNKIVRHYYGHYHKSNIEYINDTKHILLGIGEMVDY